MKFVVAGGNGQIGQMLRRHFSGHEIVILSRDRGSRVAIGATNENLRYQFWDGHSIGPWSDEIDQADVVINLAGRSVNCRYKQANRKAIKNSRINSTRVLGQAICAAKTKPRLWLQSSTATIYAHRLDAPNDEESGLVGGDEPNVPGTWQFSVDVAKAWEASAKEIKLPAENRLVLMRSSMVMSPDSGGVFDVLMSLAKRGLGGRNGNGQQFISWIHETDFVNAIQFLIDQREISGAVNICSPNPIPNADFMRELRKAAKIKIGLPATIWMLEIGAWLMNTETELILKSRRVIPKRLLDHQFRFRYPNWNEAVVELVQRHRRN